MISEELELMSSTELDHEPKAHPASPSHDLPDSFATYRKKAQQHGPLGGRQQVASTPSTSAVGERPGAALGSVRPAKGQFFDRSDLPKRFGRTPWTAEEIEAIDSGGATMWS